MSSPVYRILPDARLQGWCEMQHAWCFTNSILIVQPPGEVKHGKDSLVKLQENCVHANIFPVNTTVCIDWGSQCRSLHLKWIFLVGQSV